LSFNSDDLRSFTEADIKDGNSRLRLFCATYGVDVNEQLLDMVYEVLSFMGDEN